MSRVTCHLSMSLDGFIAGPEQSPDDPIGVGGMQLLQWQLSKDERVRHGPQHVRSDSRSVVERLARLVGDDPPYHAPVFVLTHHEHDPIEMAGGTTFHFVNGFEAALDCTKDAAGEADIRIAGGASTVRRRSTPARSTTSIWTSSR